MAKEITRDNVLHYLKGFLIRKGYLNPAEAGEEGDFNLVCVASWSAYSMNVLGVTNAQIPWNAESVPESVMAEIQADGEIPEAPEPEVEKEEEEAPRPPAIDNSLPPSPVTEETKEWVEEIQETGENTEGQNPAPETMDEPGTIVQPEEFTTPEENTDEAKSE